MAIRDGHRVQSHGRHAFSGSSRVEERSRAICFEKWVGREMTEMWPKLWVLLAHRFGAPTAPEIKSEIYVPPTRKRPPESIGRTPTAIRGPESWERSALRWKIPLKSGSGRKNGPGRASFEKFPHWETSQTKRRKLSRWKLWTCLIFGYFSHFLLIF